MINLEKILGKENKNLQEILDSYKKNIKEHIVENYIQEPLKLTKGKNARKKKIYSLDTETSKKLLEDGTSKNVTYATMYMDLDDDSDTCYMHRCFEDFIKCFENNDDHKSLFYAHNGSSFDYRNMVYSFLKMGYKILGNEVEKSYFGTYEIVDKRKRKLDDLSKTIEIIYKDGKIYSIECVVKTVYLIPERQGKNWIYHELSFADSKATYGDLKKIEKYRVDKKLIFKDSLLLLAGSLENLCRESLDLQLPKEDLEYWIYRDKNTKLTDREYFYCYADVFGLKYLVKNVIYRMYHFKYTSYNKNSECFVYNSEDIENQYKYAMETSNHTKYLIIDTPEIYDRLNISDLDIALASKLTSASYSFTILKWFMHYEVCKTIYYLINNPGEIKTEFQKYLIKQYKNNYKKRESKLKKGEKIKFVVDDSFRLIFPKLNKIIDSNNRVNATWFIKASYHGGRCFTGKNFYNMYRKGKFNTYYRGNGTVIDANSLYPTQMRNKPMPYGYYEVIDTADFVNHEDFYLNDRISFIKFQVDDRVTLKRGKFPMQRVTNTICEGFNGNESFITNVKNINGIEVPISMNLTLNSIDYKNFMDSYNVPKIHLNKVISFKKTKGLFDSFIDYFYEIKKNRKGCERANAKLVLNSSYGKMGVKPVSNDYDIYLGENGIMVYGKKYVATDNEGKECILSERFLHEEINTLEELQLNEDPNYMPVASVITAEGRSDLKFVSEKLGMENFLYCDTDSWHGKLSKEEIIDKLGDLIHDKDLGKWAVESEFTEANYLGSKRYAENIKTTESKKVKLDNFYYSFWDIKCCGIPGKTQTKIAKVIKYFDYCPLEPKQFKKLLSDKKLIIVNEKGKQDNKGFLYKNIDTNEIITGAFVVNKSREGVDGVCILQQPYLITPDLYLYGSDLD